MATPIVFFDLAGEDVAGLKAFYGKVFSWESDAQHQFAVPVETPVHAAFRQDPTEMRLYMGVDDVAEVLRMVESHGGSVDAPRFEVPGVVVLGLFRDPAGNPMGLVEMDGQQPKVP
ncbi:MAG: VOC family protein [Pseudomonadota bacterium]